MKPTDRLAMLLAKVRSESAAKQQAANAESGVPTAAHKLAVPASIPVTGTALPSLLAPVTTINLKQEPATTGTSEASWHPKQQEAIDMASQGRNFCLIGAAGTGKTTVTREIVQQLLSAGKIPPLQKGTKVLNALSPGVVICSFTRKAVANIRKGLTGDLKGNCVTLHALLEFEPEQFEYENAKGSWKKSMQFVPRRTAINPLPSDIKVIIFEESSMISTELYQLLLNALHHKPLMIFLGDIQQLPPVYGTAVLGYRLLDLPTVELTHVYRQALESPIIRLAHHMLAGKVIYGKEFDKWHVPGKLTLHAWSKRIDADRAGMTAAVFFKKLVTENRYNPEEDIILMPFNKAFGTIELNKSIAQFLGAKREAVVHEVISGFEKHYLAEEDRVLYDRREATIIKIALNMGYIGVQPQLPSTTLDRWGCEHSTSKPAISLLNQADEEALNSIDAMMEMLGSADIEDRTTKASHVITMRLDDNEQEVSIDTSADVNKLLMGYALTVHKAQGSEWRRVFLLLHKSHAVMLQRELLYTAVTRAREELYVICEPDSFVNGVLKQKIRGNSLQEKAEYFMGKKEEEQKKLNLNSTSTDNKEEE